MVCTSVSTVVPLLHAPVTTAPARSAPLPVPGRPRLWWPNMHCRGAPSRLTSP